jgi:signal transduction histidine kinase
VLWWIVDEVYYTRRVVEETIQHYEEDAISARLMLSQGLPADTVLAHFPGLVADPGPKQVAVNPAIVERLHSERKDRLDRFGWEGSFFLLVIIAGVGVLARAMRQDTQLRKRQQNFVAAVSHEFKSPIASMRLSAETLQLRRVEPDKQQRILQRLVDDLDRLETTVVNILDTARVEEGALELEPTRIDVSSVIQQVVQDVEMRAAEAAVTIETELSDGLEVEADPVAMRSVLRNLVDNALKATEGKIANSGGDEKGRIRVAARLEGRFVRVEVADDGVGFAPEEAQHLFKKFYRPGDEMQRESRGSGLGLYLVEQFVKLDGGRVEAHSAGKGKGAVFSTFWPSAGEARG